MTMTTHPTLRDTLTEAVRSHALYRVSGAAELWRCTCNEWEAQGLDDDPWQAHLTDAFTTAVQPYLDGQAWADLTAERDALASVAEQWSQLESKAEAERDEARATLAAFRTRWREEVDQLSAGLAAANAREQAVREENDRLGAENHQMTMLIGALALEAGGEVAVSQKHLVEVNQVTTEWNLASLSWTVRARALSAVPTEETL